MPTLLFQMNAWMCWRRKGSWGAGGKYFSSSANVSLFQSSPFRTNFLCLIRYRTYLYRASSSYVVSRCCRFVINRPHGSGSLLFFKESKNENNDYNLMITLLSIFNGHKNVKVGCRGSRSGRTLNWLASRIHNSRLQTSGSGRNIYRSTTLVVIGTVNGFRYGNYKGSSSIFEVLDDIFRRATDSYWNYK